MLLVCVRGTGNFFACAFWCVGVDYSLSDHDVGIQLLILQKNSPLNPPTSPLMKTC